MMKKNQSPTLPDFYLSERSGRREKRMSVIT